MRKLKIAIILSLIFISLSNVVLSNAISFEGKIHKNIYVRDVDLSNLTREEAKKKINNILNESNCFILKLDKKEYVFKKEYIDVNYNVNDLVDKAYNIGRNEGIISNIKTKTNLNLGEKKVLEYEYSVNERKLNDYLNCLDKQVLKKPIDSTIRVDDGAIVVTKDEYGYRINKDKLKALIISKIENLDYSYEIIPTIDLKPNYLYDELIKIDTVLGKFDTCFNSKNENRANNIRVAAKATSNIILKQGEVFSFNSSISNSNLAKYFKEAPVIMNGKSDKGIGGGMCQVSSTIYNAALYAGMDIVNATNHSIPSPYIEKGRDATVSDGCIDFKFLNKYDKPILIYNQVYGNRIISTIYGNKEDNKEIEVFTKITKVIPIKTVRKYSTELNLGEMIIKQEGRKGYKVKTYRIYKDGDKKSTEFVEESYYPPQEKIIIYGTREDAK